MRTFYTLITIVITLLIAVVTIDYIKIENSSTAISNLTKQHYYAIEANFLEPTQESIKLSKKANSIYPQMPQINKLDFIYE